MLSLLSKFNAHMVATLHKMLGVILLLISAILFHSVVMRYLFNNPVTWSEDAAKILLVWMTLLGAPGGLRKGAHVSIDLIVEKLPHVLSQLLRLVSLLAVIYVSWMIVRHGWLFALQGMRRIVPSLEWLPFGFAYLALPVGYGLMILVCVELIAKHLLSMKLSGRPEGE